MMRWQQEGVEGLLVGSQTEWLKTPISPADKSKEKRVAKLTLDENGTLEGDVTIEYTGHLGVERKLLNDDDSPVQREENLKDAFGLVSERGIAGRHVVIVDDVMTTGATLKSVARTLSMAEPASISAVVVAIADPLGQDFSVI